MIRILAWGAALLAVVVLSFPAHADNLVFYGYVEGDYAYIAPRQNGMVAKVMVTDGQQVAANAPLFTMDSERERLALDAAKARLAMAQATWQDKNTGLRPEEIAIIEERLSSAEATFALAMATFKRTQELRSHQAVSASRYDQDLAAQQNAEASVHQLTAELNAARLPARSAQLEAAHQGILSAQAEVSQAELDLNDRTGVAPEAGRVDRVFLQAGEYAAAGTPVVSILPPSRIKFRFYVPQSLHAQLKPGESVLVDCGGCEKPIKARITYMASQAQYTPPFIYSLEERDKLVFLVEARPEGMVELAVGQPIDVRLTP